MAAATSGLRGAAIVAVNWYWRGGHQGGSEGEGGSEGDKEREAEREMDREQCSERPRKAEPEQEEQETGERGLEVPDEEKGVRGHTTTPAQADAGEADRVEALLALPCTGRISVASGLAALRGSEACEERGEECALLESGE
mmetsp:Transcript_26433/g.56100  ORF Transcript_26433/g.56100 Transcript_26433/m.56100 type:complete len:141 (-) Transcript_26433:81-503(-)